MRDLAENYFRVRALKMDLYDDFDFEWNKEIIYSGYSLDHFSAQPIDMKTLWRVDVINLEDDEVLRQFINIVSRDEAHELLGQLKSDLHMLSRLEFVAKHLVEQEDRPSS